MPEGGWETSSVQFQATVGEGENALYESDYFHEGDEIRIYCPVNYSIPNFIASAGKGPSVGLSLTGSFTCTCTMANA